MPHRYSSVMLIGALVLAATACSASPGVQVDPPTALPATATTLPLDAYWPEPNEEVMLNAAKRRVAVECMRTFGFDDALVPAYPSSAISFARLRRAQLLEERLVARHGYHYEEYPAAQPHHIPPTGPAVRAAPKQAAAKVFAGRVGEHGGKTVPFGGCRAEAERALADGAPWPGQVHTPHGAVTVDDEQSLQNFILSLRHESLERSLHDRRLRKADAQWSDCMKHTGFDHRSPVAAAEDARWNTDEVTELERRTAVADLHCRAQTGYEQTQETVQAQYERQLIELHAVVMRVIKRNLDVRLGNARAHLN